MSHFFRTFLLMACVSALSLGIFHSVKAADLTEVAKKVNDATTNLKNNVINPVRGTASDAKNLLGGVEGAENDVKGVGDKAQKLVRSGKQPPNGGSSNKGSSPVKTKPSSGKKDVAKPNSTKTSSTDTKAPSQQAQSEIEKAAKSKEAADAWKKAQKAAEQTAEAEKTAVTNQYTAIKNMPGPQRSEIFGEGIDQAITNGTSAKTAIAAQNAATDASYEVLKNGASESVQNAITPEMIAQAQSDVVAGGKKISEVTVEDTANALYKRYGDTIDKAALEGTAGVKDEAIAKGAEAAKETVKQSGETTQLTDEAARKMGEQGADASEVKAADKGIDEGLEKKVEEAREQMKNEQVVSFNYGQYALLVKETLVQNDAEDATRDVTVKGAEELQDSQGTSGTGASTKEDDGISETTIASSVETLNALLKSAIIDLSLLSTDPVEEKKPTVLYQDHEGGIASIARPGTNFSSTTTTTTSTATDTQTSSADLTTKEEKEIRRRRALLLGEWATAATQIGEGNNALSRSFYDRADEFVKAANDATGSLGGITSIADTDRFVLFELTRGAVLSAVGLGLQGATTLNDASEVWVTKASTSQSGASTGK